MKSIHKIVVGLLIVSSISLSGCQDQSMYEKQISDVSEYNAAVDNTKTLFKENESIANKNVDVVVDAITCNKIDKKGYALFNITKKLDREPGENDEHYMFRCIDTLCESSYIRTFEEYHNYVNNISTFTNNDGKFIYKYGNAYEIENGCYASVDSNYLCQFIVISSNSDKSLKCRVFWEHGKIQMIVMQ